MDDPPYIPDDWKNLKLEFTDEYIEKRKRIKKINKLNDISLEPPPIRKKSNKYKKNNIFKKESLNKKQNINKKDCLEKKESLNKKQSLNKKDCLEKNSHCIIL